MSDTPSALRILTVCSHNRTRSVMTAAMLDSMFGDRVGGRPVVVASAGFGPPDLPPIPDAVDAMARRGLDVSAHRSRRLDLEILESADLVLAAERDHVVRIATISPIAYRRSMTLPEFLVRSGGRGSGADADVSARIVRLTEDRTAGEYLRTEVGEIADPTGSAPRAFEAAVEVMEEQCTVAAARVRELLT